MKKYKKKNLTVEFLKKLGVPQVLIPGLIIASILGWTGWQNMKKASDYHKIKQIFPIKTVTSSVVDGDTMTIENGMTLRLLGIDAPARGEENYQEAKDYLAYLVDEKQLTLEYDTYQDDKFGRILAYVWIACMESIKKYCRDDRALVNEIMLKEHFAKKVTYSKRKKLKYDSLLSTY